MKIETFENTIKVDEYIEKYVNVAEFLEYCKECGNYGKKWSCPEYDFDPLDYWKKYNELHVVGKKMILEEDEKEQYENLILQLQDDMTKEFYAEEEKQPGSISLCAGSCRICGENNCSKKIGEPCRYPDKMRYSIESLGGNVGLTASRLLGIELEWIEEGKLPNYFVLVGGILR